MDQSLLGDFIKIYGPLGLGWVLSAYLIWFIINRYDKHIEATISLAKALEGLSQLIRERVK